jgi:LacI family repressor for deo operon, udp, cdd, tsx, nupC, and nupG
MFELRLPVRDEWIVPGTYTMDSGRAAAQHFMHQEEMPTAIFSANDEMAIGLIAEFRQHGIECPRDVSVMGFDDIGVAQNYFPALTTMRQPREEIGRMATETLINILEGTVKSPEPVRVVLKSELIVRESTKPIAA